MDWEGTKTGRDKGTFYQLVWKKYMSFFSCNNRDQIKVGMARQREIL